MLLLWGGSNAFCSIKQIPHDANNKMFSNKNWFIPLIRDKPIFYLIPYSPMIIMYIALKLSL
ncbi:hypothetical protein SAMN05421780_10849 [Flexibacter flexilis DSM 6793]|uniref:Uncharacterized protein n=1 Tax=Flexibacter flexilis DSM 6793 TaxID=927664 RepID=A0A1I1L460_9BACT|nr:hypothetical protein SAMN05421780_10849 [Flexibacter flexilis DSM 6793]